MATALRKRTSKFDVSVKDLTCPICLGILIEPLTLPCAHNFCSRCLLSSNEHNNLNCPICRIRFSSWLRKTKSPVNSELWKIILAKFPKEIEKKYKGVDDEVPLNSGSAENTRVLAKEGELRLEFEKQLQQERALDQEQLKRDEILAKSLVEEDMRSKEELRVPSDVLGNDGHGKTLSAEVCLTASVSGEARLASAESESGSHDSIDPETMLDAHFKPIKVAPRTGRNYKLTKVVPHPKSKPTQATVQAPNGARRVIGCTWSAFRGKARIEAQRLEALANSEKDTQKIEDETSSTRVCNPTCFPTPEASVDTNENHKRTVNGATNKRWQQKNKKSMGNRSEKSAKRSKQKNLQSTIVSLDFPKESDDKEEAEAVNSRRKRKSNNSSFLDEDEVVKEQKKIEKALKQEKEDFELACKLQAEFELENGPRTRRARRNEGSASTSSQPETALNSIKTRTRAYKYRS